MNFPAARRLQFRFPGPEDRTTFVGSTGSGKTVFALWTLSQAKLYNSMPLIVVDAKRDDHIAKLNVPEIRIDKAPPKTPGIYVLRPDAMESENWRKNRMEPFLRQVWENGRTMLYFDEIYLVPGSNPADSSPALRSIYTTGRSRQIPVYSLMQRPVGVLRYPITEASHRIVFSVTDGRDIKTMHNFIPRADLSDVFGEDGNSFQPFHSLWRDVNRKTSFQFSPCPEIDKVIYAISESLKRSGASARWI